ncbi:hypothetical protein [Halohasta salina]|uniref:hypothetical protein n=1 Tax=Halohasta salina TaxID=2961621 RepID=UPI0020A2CE39|nr:hypothetical protein [Halohasta salina]
MNRRTVLSGATTAAVFGLAGCVDDAPAEPDAAANESTGSDDSGGSDDDFWQSVDELPTFREPTVVDFETAPLTAAIVGRGQRTDDGFAVGMDFRSGATAEAPATLVATVANTRPFEQPLELRRLGPLDSPSLARMTEGDRTTVYLAPTEAHPLAETVPTTERDDGRWRLADLGDDWYAETVTVDGETGFVAEYHLVGHHLDDEPPIGPGRYRFERDDRLAIVAWSTDEPGPDGNSGLAGREPPGLPGEQSTVWYHESTPSTERFLRPDAEQVEPPERIGFELVNHSRESISGNPYYWRLHKLVDGGWYPIAPWEWPQPAAELTPGDRSATELGVYHEAAPSSTDGRAVGFLGGGLYAYTGGFDTETEQYAALLAVDAPAIAVDIESDAEIVEEGSTTVVELPNHAEARRPATFTVRRADGEPDRELVPEQLPRRPFRGLRNALPLFDADVDAVRVKTDRGTALRLAGYEENETVTIRYEDETYSAVGTLDG